jgi:hypothetical protein
MLRAVVLILVFAGPVAGQSLPLDDYPVNAPIPLALVHEGVGQYLSDPDSARYERIAFVESWSGPVVCGLVSWRNPVNDKYFPAMPFAAPVLADLTGIKADEGQYGVNLVARSACAAVLGL